MLRRTFSSAAILVLPFLVGSGLFAEMAQAQTRADRLDGIVAVVGTHPILMSDVEAMAMTMASRGAAPTLDMRRAALEEMITHSLIAERAMRDTTIVVREDEVTMTLEQRTQELIRQMGSQEAVERMYGKSLLQLREDHRAEVRRQLMAQALQRRIVQNIRITPAEVRQWFNQIPADSLPDIPELVRIAQIVRFPAIEQEARESARERIDVIRDSVLAGATIEEMARRHSADPGSRTAGGRYSGVNINDLVTEFGAVAATIDPGEISHVFETQFGFHFMRVNDRRGDLLDFNHVLISVDETRTDPTAALRTLEMVRDSVVNKGAAFARLARDFSEDQGSSARGGNVVVPQTGDRDLRFEALSPQWRATIDGLEVGEVSRPEAVTLLDGRPAYHIVMLQRRVSAHRMSLETDWVLAEEFALQNKRQEVFMEWVKGLRKEVYVGCLDEVLCPSRDGSAAATR